MTRVLHILDHSLPLHSGYTFRTRAILKSQQAAGLTVRGVTGPRHADAGPEIEEIDGLTFHRVAGRFAGPPGLSEWREIEAFREGIEGVARQWQPEVLHAHSPALCGMAGLRAAKRLGLPFVYEIRAFWEDAAVGNGTGREGSLKYRLTRALENRVVAGADAVFTICKGLRDDLVARGHDGEKIGLSPNGVDLALFGDPVARDDALAHELGIGAGPVVGFIGSFYDYEGLDDLVAALPALRQRHPHAQLLLVGGGPMDKALRAQAAASPAGNAIVFTGRVPHAEVERYYSLIDVLAYPRKHSRLTDLVTPLKPLEAMAQRRIVAASDVGGHRELITDGQTGLLFPPDDPAGMAASLADFIDRRDSWPTMREAGRAHVAAHHDWARNVQRYQRVYQDLIGHDGSAVA
ncbi:TIGR04063 family PEP-CTERM/XrtA system glycosyltransferase [Qipengyuania flava]|uniref:TIGR04063 family PEP-CTERM/XrtA system glycosyltransferase n=2 Tax=Qipengyuania flava TaxID=192812 RepID=UPI001C56CAB6|nr:TIGR04063 family PEP-CTERM/XrtA system glycosyltransferase [Qipengyuania flava]MBW3167093.1 glycosyltransferase, exosortase A system-associated [Qipengyuania flava]MBY5964331.1 glycosyltransferase, exosortase A system-associated [Qipengyuania flava]MBY6010655.1 glycosyltransferase, exosortase A system-associated [Qipengyuania flava]MBY6025097.1 glycosyltransferase, exosortase A system-associated [Qipengyuania flava]